MKENHSDPLSCVVALESFVKETWLEDKEFENLNFNRFAGTAEASEQEKSNQQNQPNNK